ncbi:hypothetical protein NFI96_029738, partial [Prochilodus magdalenae]
GSSDVFRPVGDSVQLDIQHPVPEFHDLLWIFNRTNVVLKYNKEERQTKLYPAYKDRVEFNEGTYSLTLKNLQKTDSGLYEANTSNSRLTAVAQHSLSVLDPVEAPVLSQSSDTCSITLTCRGYFLSIRSSCYKDTCEEKEVTSPGGVTLSLSVRGSSIICNYSNPASWKEALLEMGELAQLCANGGSKKPTGPKTDLTALSGIVLVFVLTAAIASASPYLTSLIKGAKRKKRARDNDKNEVKPALICEKHKAPVADLTILVFCGKCQTSSTGPASSLYFYNPGHVALLTTVVALLVSVIALTVTVVQFATPSTLSMTSITVLAMMMMVVVLRLVLALSTLISITDPVEAPVLTLQLIRDTCNITLTCRGHDLSISSRCYNETCEEKEVTSPGGVALSLSVRGSSIICNHSNPFSWKEDVLEMGKLKQLCADGDPVEAPVLTLQLSRDICNISLTCSGHEYAIDSGCYKETCREKILISSSITISLYVRGSSIICNQSNPASWKEDVLEMGGLQRLCADGGSFRESAMATLLQLIFTLCTLISITDPVKAPVLTHQVIRYTCSITLTCRGHDLSISSSCYKETCEEKEVTSPGGVTLSLSVRGSSIICNHSNPVSWKEAVLEMGELKRLCADGGWRTGCGGADPVEAPVLTLQLSRDICNISLTCRGHDLSINSTCYKETCEKKEATSPGGVTLSLSVRGSSIICNHSNPVSWKEDVLEMGELKRLCADGGSVSPPAGVSVCVLKTGLYSITLILMLSAVITVHIRARRTRSS